MIVNANSVVQHVIQVENGIIKHAFINIKIIISAKKDYRWNPSTCTCEISKYLKSIANTSVIKSDEIISVMNIEMYKNDKCYSNKCNKKLS